MNIRARIDADLKQAMLARDAFLTQVLRDLKSVFLYEEVAKNARETGLDDVTYEQLIAREVKKRDESITLYEQGGNTEAADRERHEQEILKRYLPEPLSEQELRTIIDEIVAETDAPQLGQVIGAVKTRAGSRADGALIAQLVKDKLGQ